MKSVLGRGGDGGEKVGTREEAACAFNIRFPKLLKQLLPLTLSQAKKHSYTVFAKQERLAWPNRQWINEGLVCSCV